MKYEEETLAEALIKASSEALVLSGVKAELSLEGVGVHWRCIAKYRERKCVIDCFGENSGYAIAFSANGVTNSNGRTHQRQEIILAAEAWLQGNSLSELYQAFSFVDRTKRFLQQFQQNTLSAYPELSQCVTQQLQEYYGFYYLWFRTNERACRLSFYSHNPFPQCEYYWDDCYLFQTLAEPIRPTALIIKRWLCENALPSSLEREFTWLETGKLAKYYEVGQGIEGEFILSWDSIEQFYAERVQISQHAAVLKMITRMRAHGYDRTLRAGHSLYTMLLSRSRRHGLRNNQPSIAFEFLKEGMNIYLADEKKLSYSTIEFTKEIDNLLKELEAQKID